MASSVVVVVAIVVGYFAYRAAANLPGDLDARPGQPAHPDVETDAHVPYNSDPPTSGPHLPYIAPWGVHTEPSRRSCRCTTWRTAAWWSSTTARGCPDLVAKLKAIVRRYPEHVILAPYPGMKTRIALTAWTRIDTFDEFDEARVKRFIKAYQGIDHHKQ